MTKKKTALDQLTLEGLGRLMSSLWTKFTGEDALIWVDALERFLRKEPTWVPQSDELNLPVPPEPPVTCWRKVNRSTIEVNLDTSTVVLPFDGAKVEWTTPGQTGWVRVRRKGNKLFVAGREITLHLVDAQKTDTIKGHDLRRELEGKIVLHPNILDALFENVHLIPESFKQDEQGRTRFIYFWGVGFCVSSGDLCVRYLYWNDGRWLWLYNWLDDDWDDRGPAALAS